MGKIRASLADVSTEFEPLPPAIYEFEIEKVDEIEKDGDISAYRVTSTVVSPDEHGRKFSDFINIVTKKGEINEIGLANLKRYFEVAFGIDEVSGPKGPDGKRSGGWSDDDFDTDLLKGKRWRGQLIIDSYTKEGETEPRRNNKIKVMEPV